MVSPIGENLLAADEAGILSRSEGPDGTEPLSDGRGDLRLSLLCGPGRWRDSDSELDALDRVALYLLIVGAVATLCIAIVAVLSRELSGGEVGFRFGLTAALGVALALLVAPSIAWEVGVRPKYRMPAPIAGSARLATAAVALGCFAGALGSAAPLAAWLPALAVAGEATLTMRALGTTPKAFAGWWHLETSSMHLGLLVAVVVLLVELPNRAAATLVVYTSLQVLAVAAAATMVAFARIRSAESVVQSNLRREAVEDERRVLAHWIHDDISSALRLARLRMETRDLSREDLCRELESLDHRIRVRRLEEILASGAAQVAEVLQPYVRIAQENRIEVTEVPTFDSTSTAIDEATGRRLHRALAVVVPNAIEAGATSMAIRISEDAAGFVLEVEDDAGGFDLDAAPAGRGLDALRRELVDGGLVVTRTRSGSRVRVLVRRAEVTS